MHPDCNEHNCGSIALYRGKCRKHYGQYSRLVRRGKTTWAELERLGKVEKQRRGRDGKARPAA